MSSIANFSQMALYARAPKAYNLENFKEYPIHFYIMHREEEKTVAQIEYMERHLSNITSLCHESDTDLCLTPLMLAALFNKVKVAKKLVALMKQKNVLNYNLGIRDALSRTAHDFARDKPEIAILLPGSTRQQLHDWTVSLLPHILDNERLLVQMAHLNVTVSSPREIK